MSFTFVIPDIHGRLDLLIDAVMARINDYQAENRGHDCKLIFLGDYIDRGPKSQEVLGFLMVRETSWSSWVCLKGNHEDMMLKASLPGNDQKLWLYNGGRETLASYGVGRASDVPDEDLKWIADRPLFHEDEHRVYVHAGVPHPDMPLLEQGEQALLWYRYPRNADKGWNGKHVVHGHSAHKDGPELFSNRTNLDCGAYFSNRLVVGVFDDDVPGGPIAVLEAQSRQPF